MPVRLLRHASPEQRQATEAGGGQGGDRLRGGSGTAPAGRPPVLDLAAGPAPRPGRCARPSAGSSACAGRRRRWPRTVRCRSDRVKAGPHQLEDHGPVLQLAAQTPQAGGRGCAGGPTAMGRPQRGGQSRFTGRRARRGPARGRARPRGQAGLVEQFIAVRARALRSRARRRGRTAAGRGPAAARPRGRASAAQSRRDGPMVSSRPAGRPLRQSSQGRSALQGDQAASRPWASRPPLAVRAR